jgi:uncharacterized protein YndB with AHSA1/START domain
MSTIQLTAEPGSPQILMTRDFDAPPSLLFRAWTDPELLSQWLGPHRMTMRVERYDVRDGGSWRYVHVEPDGTEHGFHGVFHGTPAPDGMVQTFEYEGAPGHVSLDTLRMEDLGDGRTRVHINSVHQTVEARDAMIASGMETGLSEGFERLDELVARLVPVR